MFQARMKMPLIPFAIISFKALPLLFKDLNFWKVHPIL